MYGVELYAAVRLAVVDEGLSYHEAARRLGIDRRTVKKMLSYSAPPGYRRTKPVRRPKLDGFTGIVDAILEADWDEPRKQRHTAHRIFARLRDERSASTVFLITHNPQPGLGHDDRSMSEGRWRARNDGQPGQKGRHAAASTPASAVRQPEAELRT